MQRSREYLYNRFKNNQKPNADDFRDLIDSSLNRQDDNPNAGWYYYQFLPSKIVNIQVTENFITDLRLRHEFMLDEYGVAIALLFQEQDRSQEVIGMMNIHIPTGVNKIIGFRAVGRMNVMWSSSVRNPPELTFQLIHSTKLFGESLFVLGSVTIDQLGPHEYDQPLFNDSEFLFHPNEGALTLKVIADLKNKENWLSIEYFGIQFA